MTKLQDVLLRNTQKGQMRAQRVAQQAQDARNKERRQLEKDAKKRARAIFKNEKPKVVAASKRGESLYSISLFDMQRNYPDWAHPLATELRRLFEKQGLRAELRTGTREPVGSDPYVEYTTHFGYLDVSWRK